MRFDIGLNGFDTVGPDELGELASLSLIIDRLEERRATNFDPDRPCVFEAMTLA